MVGKSIIYVRVLCFGLRSGKARITIACPPIYPFTNSLIPDDPDGADQRGGAVFKPESGSIYAGDAEILYGLVLL